MKAKKYLLSITFFVFLISCSSSDNDTRIESFTGGVGVYTCGQDIYSSDIDIDGRNAKIYKSEKSFELTDNTSFSYAKAIVVSGNDVYVAGSSNWTANIWKNGIVVNLEEGKNAEVTDMFVIGNDVYVSGFVRKDIPTYGVQPVAVLWKNGKEISLPEKNHYGRAYSVFVSGTDVYVSGSDQNTATIWKNGIPIKLTDGSQSASVNDVVVVGNDIYAIGDDNGIAKFWKNGIDTNFSDRTTQVNLKKIVVIGTDVYIGGEEYISTQHRVAKIWKNGVYTNLTDGKVWAFFSSMFVDTANNVYMVTNEPIDRNNVTCKIWKNGVLINTYNNYQFINDIFVVSN